MEENRKFGWIPDLPDHRDLTYKLNRVLAQNLPPEVDLRFGCPPIQNQYNLGCCTGFGVSAAVQYDQLSQKDPDAFHPSEMFIYYNAREILGTIEQDSGAMIRDAIQSIGKIGACPIDLWPYDVNRFRERPPQPAYDSATKYVATMYSRVPQTLVDLKACLASNHPFVFGFTVYDGMMSTEVQQTGILNMPQPSEKMHGGHCVMAVGYDDSIQRFIIRNSWGTEWGQKGYFTMPYDYLLNENLATDIWVIEDVKI